MSIVLFAATETSLNREACRKTVEQSQPPCAAEEAASLREAGYSAGKKHSDLLDVMHLPTVSVSSCTKKNPVMQGILKDRSKVIASCLNRHR